MAEKAQFMLLVEPEIRDRMDALRIVLSTSRADIGRSVISKHLHREERVHAARLERLTVVAEAHGYPHWQSLVWELIRHSASGNTAGRGQKLPSLEELEDPAHAIWSELTVRPAATDVSGVAPTATFSG